MIYSYLIVICDVGLLLNIYFFDNGRNAGIGFRTKKSMSSKENWVFSQTIFYIIILLLNILVLLLYSFKILTVSMVNIMSIGSIVISGIMTEVALLNKK
ncbi:hypothetical protein GUI51_14475 [Enterococcus mundtii]|uniref:SdpI family protein n=1 Tax=Enterococcus mundtii TaxID=53346 RepID=UPI001021F33F|nr:SdpI family protein [Enterococcus mundtii]MZU11558.1 hypothetical protein [Bifidobacterium longum]MZZ60198.1 hypothetical protein [Enterococcus mundtii]MZZ63145.1 hypothetical protein [Enterococcus mundtii]MZZ70183.1 hypothetical protein [Enterococcus mundtii]MZZ99008.1 hypothetical protein [Enterococcus mundtii]